jgi:dTDP-4-dehydrorhamnose reductase
MKILILGASGLVGGNCMRYFQIKEDVDVVGTYFSYEAKDTVKFNTLNLSDPENFDIAGYNPDVILHCGALTWVDYCEENPEESYQKTVQSTVNTIDLAKTYNAKLVYISSDYVFDGKSGPYTEADAVNPISLYGKHKLEAEQKVIETLPSNHLVLRITNVYGDEERNKNFISRMLDNVLKNEPMEIKLPVDQYATPVNAADIARSLYLLLKDNKTGIYNIASTDFVNRVQLTELILKHFPEHTISITPIFTADMNQPAPRPLIGGLITKKFLDEYPNFHFTNVDDYLRKKLSEINR